MSKEGLLSANDEFGLNINFELAAFAEMAGSQSNCLVGHNVNHIFLLIKK